MILPTDLMIVTSQMMSAATHSIEQLGTIWNGYKKQLVMLPLYVKTRAGFVA